MLSEQVFVGAAPTPNGCPSVRRVLSEQVSVGEGVTRRYGQPISPYENMRNNLKLLRKQRGLTQLQLQLATGIEQSLISKFESGQRIPPTDTLLVLADFYGVSIDYILMRTDNPKINK